jgi:hypothetical protein
MTQICFSYHAWFHKFGYLTKFDLSLPIKLVRNDIISINLISLDMSRHSNRVIDAIVTKSQICGSTESIVRLIRSVFSYHVWGHVCPDNFPPYFSKLMDTIISFHCDRRKVDHHMLQKLDKWSDAPTESHSDMLIKTQMSKFQDLLEVYVENTSETYWKIDIYSILTESLRLKDVEKKYLKTKLDALNLLHKTSTHMNVLFNIDEKFIDNPKWPIDLSHIVTAYIG